MRQPFNEFVEKCRVRTGELRTSAADGANGAFFVPLVRFAETFKVICSDGGGWDHVSVSLPHRCPRWGEMAAIKDLFFLPEECVMQLHPPASRYVNNHPYCLHLWRPQRESVPQPPLVFV